MDLRNIYKNKKSNAIYLVGLKQGSYLDYITYTSKSSPKEVMKSDFQNLTISIVPGKEANFHLLYKCDLDSRGLDMMIKVVPKDESNNVTGNPHNQFRVFFELCDEDTQTFFRLWKTVVKSMQDLNAEIVMTKINSSSEEYGKYNGDYLKICQTLRNAIHAQIFGFRPGELIKTAPDKLDNKQKTYLHRPFQDLFNNLISDFLTTNSYPQSKVHTHKISNALIFEADINSSDDLILTKKMDSKILNLFRNISLEIFKWKKKPKNFTNEEIWKSVQLNKHDRPILKSKQARKSALKALLENSEYSWISNSTKSQLIEELCNVTDDYETDKIFRYGPNQCLTFRVEGEKAFVTVAPTFHSGKGGDPVMGIFVESTLRELDKGEKESIKKFSNRIEKAVKSKFPGAKSGDWDYDRYIQNFKAKEEYKD